MNSLKRMTGFACLKFMVTSFFFSLFASPAFADGFSKAESLLDKVKTGLGSLSLVVVTIAIFWVGYKVLWGGSTIRECTPIIIGAIIIAGAAEIASMLVN